jgi:hypothetical protein
MSLVASYGAAAFCCCWFSKPMWWAAPIFSTPSSDGGGESFSQSGTRKLWPFSPITQSVTKAPVVHGSATVELSRRAHGSDAPRGWSSLKSVGVPLSSNAPEKSSTSVDMSAAQTTRSSGYTSSSWQAPVARKVLERAKSLVGQR